MGKAVIAFVLGGCESGTLAFGPFHPSGRVAEQAVWFFPHTQSSLSSNPNSIFVRVPTTKVGLSQRPNWFFPTANVKAPSQEPKWYVSSQNGRFLVMEFTVEMFGINEYVNFFAKGIKS
jgi:hypothetical protein